MSRSTSRRRAAIVAGLTGLMGYGAIQYRRNNKRAAIAALRDAVEPPQFEDPLDATEVDLTPDVAHAPGHRHLPPPPSVTSPNVAPRSRARADRSGHPGRFS
jgi:hypothetical protein